MVQVMVTTALVADRAMERYADGDDAAFAELYMALAPRIFAYLRRHTRDAFKAEDLFQHTFLQVHRARSSFIPGAEVTAWAFAIARRLVIDASRKSRREVPLAHDEEVSRKPRSSPQPWADDLVYAKELAACAAHELERLPDSQRTAFDLVRRQERSVHDAASALGTTCAAVKLRVHRLARPCEARSATPPTSNARCDRDANRPPRLQFHICPLASLSL